MHRYVVDYEAFLADKNKILGQGVVSVPNEPNKMPLGVWASGPFHLPIKELISRSHNNMPLEHIELIFISDYRYLGEDE